MLEKEFNNDKIYYIELTKFLINPRTTLRMYVDIKSNRITATCKIYAIVLTDEKINYDELEDLVDKYNNLYKEIFK